MELLYIMLQRYVYHENENGAFITLFSILKSAQIRNVNIDETRLTWFAWFDHNAACTAATLALNIVFKQFFNYFFSQTQQFFVNLRGF